MNPIDSSHTTGTPNPLARTPKTTTDSATQVPGLSKDKQTTPAAPARSANSAAAQKIADQKTRAQEVEQTRQLIAQGAYTVDLGKLADAMIKKQVIQ